MKESVDAVRDAGDLANTTFLIVSDHGQQSLRKQIHCDVMLKQAGFNLPTSCIPEGGFALVYQKGATGESRAALKAVFAGKPGVRDALFPVEVAKEGWPTAEQTDQGPDLLVYAENGYAFSGGKTEEAVTETKEIGAHGYPNTEPLMKAIFIASGAGIAKKGEIAEFDNVDVAATIARLLNVPLPGADGKALTQILTAPGAK